MSPVQHNHRSTPFLQKNFPIVLVCDGIDSPANAGGLFRICDAFGVPEVIFGPPMPQLSSSRVKRTSRSTHQWIQHRTVSDLALELEKLKSAGLQVIGLEITDSSVPISHLELKSGRACALVIGGERNGISESILELVDELVHIEMFGKNSSMNVVQATGIALYELTSKYAGND